MLHIFRSKRFAKWTLIGLLIVIIPAFVLWGAGSISKGQKLIGTIGSQKVYPDDLVKSLEGMKAELLLTYYGDYDTFNRILQNRALMNRLAWERLIFLNAADKAGIKATNKDVIAFLSRHPLFIKNGVFNQQVYDHIIKNIFRTESRQFEELVRQNLRISTLQNELFKDIDVPDEEVMDLYKKTNDTVDISYVLVDKELFKNVPAPSDEEVKAFFEENIRQFYTPAKAEIEYIEFSFANEEEKKDIAAKIGEIYPKLLEKPENFKEIADEYGLTYKKVGPLSQNDLIPGIKFSQNIYDIAFRLDEGAISPPLVTGDDKGDVYIVRKINDIPSKPPVFEEVRETVVERMTDQKRMIMAGERAETLYGDISGNNISLEEAAKKIDREVQTAETVSFTGYIENIGPADIIVEKALLIEPGNTLSPVVTPKGILLVRLDKITPADETKFEETKENLRMNILTRKRGDLLQEWFNDKAPKTDLKRPLEGM